MCKSDVWGACRQLKSELPSVTTEWKLVFVVQPVGADAHIGPWKMFVIGADVGIGPYGGIFNQHDKLKFEGLKTGAAYLQKNMGSLRSPCTRFSRMHPIMTCTNLAGGLPLRPFTAPNVHSLSKQEREVCKPGRKLTSLFKNVGPKGHITHQAGKTLKMQNAECKMIILLPLLRKAGP